MLEGVMNVMTNDSMNKSIQVLYFLDHIVYSTEKHYIFSKNVAYFDLSLSLQKKKEKIFVTCPNQNDIFSLSCLHKKRNVVSVEFASF